MMPDGSPQAGGQPRARGKGLFGRNSPVSLENIVVIALVTVLAAVMVFVFAGYANKAKDERYVFEAREHVIATRAVLSESFVTGDLVPVVPSVVVDGEDRDGKELALKAWSLAQISEYASGDENRFHLQAMELIEGAAPSLSGTTSWELWLVGPASAASVWDADGFLYVAWPEDQADQADQEGREGQANRTSQTPSGSETVVYVTYRMDRVETNAEMGEGADFLAAFWQKATYNPQAGFVAYRFS
jgi:hypothetical protein